MDAYGAVKNEDSEEVFLTSRLEFVTEVVVLKRIVSRAADEQPIESTAGQPTTNTDGQLIVSTAGQPKTNTDGQPTTATSIGGQPTANADEQPATLTDKRRDERLVTQTDNELSVTAVDENSITKTDCGQSPTLTVEQPATSNKNEIPTTTLSNDGQAVKIAEDQNFSLWCFNLWQSLIKAEQNFDLWCGKKWDSSIKIFQDQRDRVEKYYNMEFSPQWKRYLIPRVLMMLRNIIWVMIGAIFAGLLWPPQVREWQGEKFKG